MDENLIYPLKKKKKETQKGFEHNTANFSQLINDVFKNELSEWSEENNIKYVFGDDIEQLIRHIFKRATENTSTLHHDKALKLFAGLKDYYRFYIDESNIAYSSKFVQFDNKKDMFCDYDAYFCDILNNCQDELKKHSYEVSPEKLFNILLLHLCERTNHFMRQLTEKGDTSRVDISENDKRKFNVVLNEYLKSELKTWNSKLLESYKNYHFGAYPYCKFIKFNSQYIVLLIVAYLDKKYINEKIEEVDVLEPVHLIIFEDDESVFDDHFLRELEFKIKHIIGNINYGQLGFVTNNSLKILVEESAETSRYWYTEGINQIFNEKKLQTTEQHKGMFIAQTAIEKLLCSDLDSLVSTEGFPFNRIFIFPDSNYKSADKNSVLDFHPGLSDEKIVLDMIVFEAGFKSNRPQDNERYLSNMERLDKNDGKNDNGKEPEMPELERYFDMTNKKIIYKSNFKIDKEGKLYAGKLLTDGKITSNECPEINYFDDLHEDDDGVEEKENFNKLKNFDLTKIPVNDQNREKIQAVIASLFVGLHGDEDGFDNDDKSSFCQSTYNLYDEDGLCFVADHSVKISEIPLLEELQQAYFDEFFKYNEEKWEMVWNDNKTNRPSKEKFIDWLSTVESKVNVISFDPQQNIANLNETDGKRYIENVGFTIVFIADNDIKKNIYNNKTESLDLKQAFTMIIRRLLREEKNQKTTIRETNELYMTLLPSLMHRAKNYIDDQGKKEKINKMLIDFERFLKTDSIKPELIGINKIEDLYNIFFSKLINEDQETETPTSDDHSYRWVSEEMRKASMRYLNRLEEQDNKRLSYELEFYFNYNFIPSVQLKVAIPFLDEAMKVVFNNAVEHTRLYSIDKQCSPLLIISINLSYHSNDSNKGFLEISFINRSETIPEDRLEQLNNPKPKQVEKDNKKDSSTGMGLFISRKQLKDTTAEGANIILKNVGQDLVESKLVLPVSLQKRYELNLTEHAETQADPKLDSKIKILYVEDEPQLKEDSEKWLEDLLGKEFNSVYSTNNYYDAAKVVQNHELFLVLMDFNFLEKKDSSAASNKYGIKLIKLIKKLLPDTPIIILSGSTYGEIKKMTQDEKIETGVIVELNSKTKNFAIEKGRVYKSLIKDLNSQDSQFLSKPIKVLMENAEPLLFQVKKDSEVKLEIDCTTANYNDFVISYEAYRIRCLEKNSIHELLILQSKILNVEKLLAIINDWISFPDQKSIFSEDVEEGNTIKVFRNDYVRTVVNYILVPEKLYEQLPISLKYWALSFNIYITTIEKPDEEFINIWQNTPFGVKGPLSKLRHDLKNKITGKEINQILKEIESAEKLLIFRNEKLHFEFDDIIKKDIDEAIKNLEMEPLRNLTEINATLDGLTDSLKKNKELKEVEKFIQIIENIKYLLCI